MVELQKGAEEIRVGLATLKGTLGVSVPAVYLSKKGIIGALNDADGDGSVSPEMEKFLSKVRPKGLLIQTDSAVTLTCPRCGKVGVLDDDQLHGRVSTKCFNERCDYHETVDWAKRLREAAGIIVGDEERLDD